MTGRRSSPVMPEISQTQQEVLRERAGEQCELCSAKDGLAAREVPPTPETGAPLASDRCVLLCATCLGQIDGSAALDPKHLSCLQAAAWSEVPAVQVTSY